jgi:hypothetical protein
MMRRSTNDRESIALHIRRPDHRFVQDRELTMSVEKAGHIGLGPAYAPSWPIAGRQNHRNGGRQGKLRLVSDQTDPARRKDD